MTNEEAIEILQEEHNYVQEPCYVMNAIKKAIEALHSADKCDQNAAKMRLGFISSEPLTLEQLREMDGQPVWLKIAGGVWGIVDRLNDCVVTSLAEDIRLNALAGLAYAYPSIDRDKWEPCEWCGSVGKTSDNWVCTLEDDELTNNHIVVRATANYCPECGRPLTEEAWELLEKHLRG